MEHGEVHHNTKFHCMGQPFSMRSDGEYVEDEWVFRLYFCIKDKLPDNIKVTPSLQYGKKFNKFQELISGQHYDKFYVFRAVPDLLFQRSPSASSSVHIGSEVAGNEMVEVKSNTTTNTSDTRSEFAQVTATLHSIAIAKILQQLKDNKKPREIVSKGLLIFMRKAMFLMTLKASVANVGVAGLNVTCKEVDFSNDTYPFIIDAAAVCGRIQYLC